MLPFTTLRALLLKWTETDWKWTETIVVQKWTETVPTWSTSGPLPVHFVRRAGDGGGALYRDPTPRLHVDGGLLPPTLGVSTPNRLG